MELVHRLWDQEMGKSSEGQPAHAHTHAHMSTLSFHICTPVSAHTYPHMHPLTYVHTYSCSEQPWQNELEEGDP